MNDGLRLSDELIRAALTPADDDGLAGLALEIRERVQATRPRRYWWTLLRPIVGPFGPPPAVRAAALLATLAALIALLALAVAGSHRPSLVGDGTMFHGGPGRTGEMAGPGPVQGAALTWTASLRGPLSNAMPVLAGGKLFVADGQGNVAVFDAASGAPGWTERLPKPAGSPAFAAGILVVGAGDGVYAIDAASGAQRWHIATNGRVQSSPAIDGGIVYIGLPDGFLTAIDLQTGSVGWRTQIGGGINRAPALGEGLVFAGGDGGAFGAVSEASGSLVWRTALGPGQVSTPAVRDGVVYVASGLDESAASHTLSAFRASDGAGLWTFRAPSGNVLYVGAVSPDLVYAVGLDGNVYALREGAERWRHEAGAPIGSVATLSGGLLYVSVSNGAVQALDATTGVLRWEAHVNGDPGPVIVDQGRLDVGNDLGELAAFSETARSANP